MSSSHSRSGSGSESQLKTDGSPTSCPSATSSGGCSDGSDFVQPPPQRRQQQGADSSVRQLLGSQTHAKRQRGLELCWGRQGRHATGGPVVTGQSGQVHTEWVHRQPVSQVVPAAVREGRPLSSQEHQQQEGQALEDSGDSDGGARRCSVRPGPGRRRRVVLLDSPEPSCSADAAGASPPAQEDAWQLQPAENQAGDILILSSQPDESQPTQPQSDAELGDGVDPDDHAQQSDWPWEGLEHDPGEHQADAAQPSGQQHLQILCDGEGPGEGGRPQQGLQGPPTVGRQENTSACAALSTPSPQLAGMEAALHCSHTAIPGERAVSDGAEGWGMHSSTLPGPTAAACNSGWMDGVFTAGAVPWAAPEQRTGNAPELPLKPKLRPTVHRFQGASLGREFTQKGGDVATSGQDLGLTYAQAPVQAAAAKSDGLLAASAGTSKPKAGSAPKQEWCPLRLAPAAQPIHRPLTAQRSTQHGQASQSQAPPRRAPSVPSGQGGTGGSGPVGLEAEAGHWRRSGGDEEGAAPMDAVVQALADKVRLLTGNPCDAPIERPCQTLLWMAVRCDH